MKKKSFLGLWLWVVAGCGPASMDRPCGTGHGDNLDQTRELHRIHQALDRLVILEVLRAAERPEFR